MYFFDIFCCLKYFATLETRNIDCFCCLPRLCVVCQSQTKIKLVHQFDDRKQGNTALTYIKNK